MHASRGRQVPGDDERRDGIMFDERHDDQLSRGDRMRGGNVHIFGRPELVHDLSCRVLHQHASFYRSDDVLGV